ALTGSEGAHTKKPQPRMVGVGPYELPPLSLERTSQRHVGQVSWLAAFPYSLHLPKVRSLSGLCRFRSAHSCGAAMDLHHLPWSQFETMTNPIHGICNFVSELTAVCSVLSRAFSQGSLGCTGSPLMSRGTSRSPSRQPPTRRARRCSVTHTVALALWSPQTLSLAIKTP